VSYDLVDGHRNGIQNIRAHQALMLRLLKIQRGTSDPELIMRTAAAVVGEYLQVDRAGFFEMRMTTRCRLP